MEASIDRSGCISCGLCAETCPDVFRMADDGLAEMENEASSAAQGCPVSVITVE